MIYDVLVIGGGIAGCSTAYFLKKRGFLTLLIEEDSICSKASLAAGAFLSPKIALPSPYRDYVNSALKFSLEFYFENFKKHFLKTSLLKFPYDEKDAKRMEKYEKFLDLEYEKYKNGYFFKDGGVLDSKEICKEMVKDVDVVFKKVKDIKREDNLFLVEGFWAKKVVFATGSEKIINLPYLLTKEILGYRYDVRFKGGENLKYNIHKKVSISAFFKNKNIIGATHIRKSVCKDLTKAAKEDKYNLLKKAKEIMDLKEFEILKIYTGSRLCTFDYFPVVGEIVDFQKTLQKYPTLFKGSKIPPSLFVTYKNLYIHTALASRGFVLAPYNAKMLADLIADKKEIDFNLTTHKRFLKFIRKNLKSISF